MEQEKMGCKESQMIKQVKPKKAELNKKGETIRERERKISFTPSCFRRVRSTERNTRPGLSD